MDPSSHPLSECQFEGCQFTALPDGRYCLDHQRRESMLKAVAATASTPPIKTTPQPDRDFTMHPSPQQQKSPVSESAGKTDPSTQKLGDAITVKPSTATSVSPNAKRQLPDKHVARKTTKVSHHQGSSHEQLSPSSNRTSVSEASTSTSNARPTKKLKISIESNRPEPQMSNSSTIMDSRRHVSPESVHRYSEERHGGLESAVDFALRPKSISLDESSKVKRHVDQGSVLNRERTHKSPPRNLYAPNNNAGRPRFPGHVGDNSHVIDLTEDDVGTHHSHGQGYPAHRRPTNGHMTHHEHLNEHNKASGHNQASGHAPVSVPGLREDDPRLKVWTNHRLRSPPLGHFGARPKRKLQDIHILPSNKQSPGPNIAPSNNIAQGGVKSTAPSLQPRPNPESNPGLSQTTSPAINLSGLSSSEPRSAGGHQMNETYASKRVQSPLLNPPGRPPIDGGHTSAIHEKSMTPPPIQQIVIEPEISRLPKTNGIHKEHPPRPHTPLNSSTTSSEPTRHPHLLSKLLPREKPSWKHLTPEERRRARVAQHDPIQFDSYIYSELNRPNRPGDPLFYMPEYARPSHPTRPATHFDYIDPRIHWNRPRSEQWLRNKREEIASRGTRKAEANFGRAAAHMARRKEANASANIRVALPERVCRNPQWMAAVNVLDEIAAQHHQWERQRMRKEKEKQKDQEDAGRTADDADADAMDVDMNVNVNANVDTDKSHAGRMVNGGEWSYVNRCG
ncbi:hypothetical protein F4809DRAFT_642576 [Biscogniauxia mediterranea]|nr:hypothetical protein F4809DRAFT_642576 [Biscogniauxia mediterranea]